MAREAVTTGDLIACSNMVVEALGSLVDRDWNERTGPIRLKRIRTACHMGDNCLAYAGQIAAGQQEQYLPFRTLPAARATPQGMLEFVGAGAQMLAATVDRFPGVVAWHPFGMTDTEGFLAMGSAEILVHGWDLAFGMGSDLQPDREICSRLTARLAPDFPTTNDSWIDLLTFCNRLPPGGASRRGWRYDVSPAGAH